MDGSWRNTQPPVNARVITAGNARHIDPLPEGQRTVAATVRKHVIDASPLGNQQLFMDDHSNAEGCFIEVPCGRGVLGANAQVI